MIEDARQRLDDSSPAAQSATKKRQRSVLQAMLEARDDDGHPVCFVNLAHHVPVGLSSKIEFVRRLLARSMACLPACWLACESHYSPLLSFSFFGWERHSLHL